MFRRLAVCLDVREMTGQDGRETPATVLRLDNYLAGKLSDAARRDHTKLRGDADYYRRIGAMGTASRVKVSPEEKRQKRNARERLRRRRKRQEALLRKLQSQSLRVTIP